MPNRIPLWRPPRGPSREDDRRAYDRQGDRGAAKTFYGSKTWTKLRAAYLATYPLCNRCPPERPTAAEEVHHKIPRDVRPDLALDWDNLEGLCRACHQRTRKEDQAQRAKAVEYAILPKGRRETR